MASGTICRHTTARGGIVEGLVLAGGAGRRLGRPKAGTSLAGEPLVARAVAIVGAHCARVIVVARPEVPLPDLGVPVVLDRPGPDCALTGVATGLAALGADEVLVLACDLPLAGPLVARLARAAPGAVVATGAAGPEPLCARYPRAAALTAADRLLAAGRLAARGLPDALAATGLPAEGDELLNVNTPGDLARAEALLSPG